MTHYSWLQSGFELIVRLAPAIIGIFWGVPLLARELETGTYRLAWTQSVTRTRWLTTKLLLVGASAFAAAGVLTLTTTWWFRAVDAVGTNQWAVFDRRNLTPVAYAMFAFTLGAFLGTVIRRTVPAMAATLGIFAFARIAVTAWVRPHLLAPLHQSMSLLSAGDFGFTSTNGTVDLVARGTTLPNVWVQSSRIVTSSGHTATLAERGAFILQNCPTIANHANVPPSQGGLAGGPSAFESCRQQAARVFHLAVIYQPAGRYWTFQWLEAAIYIASRSSPSSAATGGSPDGPTELSGETEPHSRAPRHTRDSAPDDGVPDWRRVQHTPGASIRVPATRRHRVVRTSVCWRSVGWRRTRTNGSMEVRPLIDLCGVEKVYRTALSEVSCSCREDAGRALAMSP